MDELRLVRREDQSLVVETEAGEVYRLIVDESVLAELRHLNRKERDTPRVSPREIQSLVRAGKSRSEIADLTGADESDIERYEEPVLAERRFILASAQAVAVRTSPAEGAEEQFGVVIAERLVGLGADQVGWSSWRDEEAGWMIGLEFESHEVSHRAIWSFEHRKGVLAPLTPDAVTLSKQGDVGDRLIPKLRAVDAADARDRFDSGAFDPETLTADFDEVEGADDAQAAETTQPRSGAEAAFASRHPSTGSIPIVDAGAEFARRREIDQRAIKTPEPELPDLGQTADLLDALRKRRGERESAAPQPPFTHSAAEGDPVQLFAAEGVEDRKGQPGSGQAPAAGTESVAESVAAERPRKGRGRTAIPSWDDILFGTRSDEDPV